jgi:hypothetical protein
MGSDDWMSRVNVQLKARETERTQESKAFNRKILMALVLMGLLLVALKLL